jgi:hypothetical protein
LPDPSAILAGTDPGQHLSAVRGAGQDVYAIMAFADDPIGPPTPSPSPSQPFGGSLCRCTAGSLTAPSQLTPSPGATALEGRALRGLGLDTYLTFSRVRVGGDLRMAFDDLGGPSGYVAQDGSPVPRNLMMMTAAAFTDAQWHWGPVTPFAGVSVGGGSFSYQPGVFTMTMGAPSRAFAFAAARCGARLFVSHIFAVGVYAQASLAGPAIEEVGVSVTVPEVTIP